MSSRDPKVRPVPGDIIATPAEEYRVQDRKRDEVFVLEARTGRRRWWTLGAWMSMALRRGTVLARGAQ